MTFDDCRLDRGLSPEEWRKLLTLSADDEGERLTGFRKAAEDTAWKKFYPAALVAIDRWTGGAADKFLFSRLEPDFGSITLAATIDPERIAPPLEFWENFDKPNCGTAAENPKTESDPAAECPDVEVFRRAALALFLLTLRDFARGRIPLGYGVNRGLGDLDLCKAILRGGCLDAFDIDLDSNQSSGGRGAHRRDIAEEPECEDEARKDDRGPPPSIELCADDFADPEKMKPFLAIQDAWTCYLKGKDKARQATQGGPAR